LADEFRWNEPINMLDLVCRARLGTAVKKSLLIGGVVNADGDDEASPERRAFCIEWAAM
jgi:tRNA splicing endonuclease